VNLDICYDQSTGRNQAISISGDDSIDFAILPNDSYFLSERPSIKNFKMMFPINMQKQSIFVKKSYITYKNTKIYIYHNSTAQMQYALGIGVPKNTESITIESVKDIPHLTHDLAGGDMVIIWEPMAELFRKSCDFTELPNSKYFVYNSLFCHKKWNSKGMNLVRKSFVELLIREWKIGNSNRNRLYKILLDDKTYLNNFKSGLGHVI
jgi:hypothetical protein